MGDQESWPESALAAARVARSAAVKAKSPSYTVEVKSGKGFKPRTYWINNNKQPCFVERNVAAAEGKRASIRPYALARSKGARRARTVLVSETFDGSTQSWASDEQMPGELLEEDTGWGAAITHRALPTFTGNKPGHNDSERN